MKTGANPQCFAFDGASRTGESLDPDSCRTFAPDDWRDLLPSSDDLLPFAADPVLLSGAMPKPRPWLVDDDSRKGPQGRPRSGPRRLAVRQLPRITVRAVSRTLSLWHAVLEIEDRQGHAVFDDMVTAYLEQLPASRRDEIVRKARRIRSDEYDGEP